jgi:hypothetical protein
MSRGNGRLRTGILERVHASEKYGCTLTELAWYFHPDGEITEARLAAIRRAVEHLVAQGQVMAQPGFYDERIRLAVPSRPEPDAGESRRHCPDCDVEWSTDTAVCWSCGS